MLDCSSLLLLLLDRPEEVLVLGGLVVVDAVVRAVLVVNGSVSITVLVLTTLVCVGSSTTTVVVTTSLVEVVSEVLVVNGYVSVTVVVLTCVGSVTTTVVVMVSLFGGGSGPKLMPRRQSNKPSPPLKSQPGKRPSSVSDGRG